MADSQNIIQFSESGERPKMLDELPDEPSVGHYIWINASKDDKEFENYFYETEEMDINAAVYLFQDQLIAEPDIGDTYFTIATSGFRSGRNHSSDSAFRFRLFVEKGHVITLYDDQFTGLEEMKSKLMETASPVSTGRLFAQILKIVVKNKKMHLKALVLKGDDLAKQKSDRIVHTDEIEIKKLENRLDADIGSLQQLRTDVETILDANHNWIDPKSTEMILNSILLMSKIEKSLETDTPEDPRGFFERMFS